MPPRLLFTDPHAAADALTFAGRTAPLGDGAVRLQASSGVLVMTSAPFAPRNLFDATPTVLGLRTLEVDPELVCDLVVDASTLAAASDDERAVQLPETALAPAWAGVSPPRRGWAESGRIAASVLAARAQWGMSAVAHDVPVDAGEDVVRVVRAAVWGAPDEDLDGLPRGTAFAAFALGFIGGDEVATVRASGPWVRVSLHRGHVLVRRPAKLGLTEVRATGTG